MAKHLLLRKLPELVSFRRDFRAFSSDSNPNSFARNGFPQAICACAFLLAS